MWILPTLIFLSVTLGIASVVVWLMPNKAQRRLQAMTDPDGKSEWIATMVNVVGPFAKLSTPTGDWELSPTRIKFINAGIRNKDAHLAYFGVKTLLPLIFAVFAYIIVAPRVALDNMSMVLILALAATAGCYLPNIVLNWKVKRRQLEILDSFPDAADLMLVCVEAGLGLDAALTKVADEIKIKSVDLAQELHLTNLEMRVGGSRQKSLANLALRTGVEEINTFATMLIQSDKFGTSLGESLRVFSEDLRQKRQTRAEEKAAKIAVKMLIPLVLCIFPSIMLVILAPAGLRIIRTVIPLITGEATAG
jgi:tight adherence protein C